MPEDAAVTEDIQPGEQKAAEESQPEQPKDTETRDLWNQVAPDLADSVGELSPEARERLLLKRLSASAASKAAKADDSKESSATDGTQSHQPTIDAPVLDPGAMKAAIAKAMEEGDSAGLADMFEKVVNYNAALGQLVLGAIGESNTKLNRFESSLSELTVPAQLRALVPTVRGANDSDIARAKEVLGSGEATTPQAALKLAVFEREADEARPAKSASEAARKKAAALRASSFGKGGSSAGQPALQRVPRTEAEWAAMMAKEAADKRQ